MYTDTRANRLGWLLDQQLGTLDGVRHAVLISADGLLHSRTSSIGQDDGERYAAIASALRGAGRSYAEEFEGGGLRQIVLELSNYVCLITQAGKNMLLLAQTANPSADVATIAHQMQELAGRVGGEMAIEARRDAEGQATG
ncbi:roadblock/LC7 domain-containing protein (plasmid) [Streptomyces sp. NBC_01281]|uniref:roadblock/LC7 domain-containing protein n=1 Tax=Streptomyces sp. NBC_01281 TaxID=2903811 RepID=UPI002E0ED5BC|nr:roadblock/LC7 domain-containing protein [Streptomyces sp. NBC_01281]